MRISIAIALMATLSIAGASGAEIGRSISDWIWPLAVENYPQIQQAAYVPARAAVEPLVYTSQEEGRRRSDKRFGGKKDTSKGVAVSIHVSKDKNKGNDKRPDNDHDHDHAHDYGGHNTPIKPTHGLPIYIAGSSQPQHKPEPVHVLVEDSHSSWGWGWIKGIMNWGDHGSIHDKLASHHLQQQEEEVIEGDTGIVSVSYGKPPHSYYSDHHESGMYNPFQGWWGHHNEGQYLASPEEDPVDEPSMSEVMVIRYPEFIKTIGKGISTMSNAMKNLGQGMSHTLTKGIHDTSAGLGSGVASIIPLEEIGNSHHDKGGHGHHHALGSGHGASFKPSHQSVAGNSQVYVDKHQSVPQIHSGGHEWLHPSNWFGYGSSDDPEPEGSTSTIYVERPKLPILGLGHHGHHGR